MSKEAEVIQAALDTGFEPAGEAGHISMETLIAYVKGELDAATAEAARDHIRLCDDCLLVFLELCEPGSMP